ncbi:hypothetical protein FOZG_18519 [Fusarium oxysporum Fo47]|uniref:Uncharacterized protein n=1 Tax=Fusarium oxysporum Fo47 TaxID=660027 RepID=W9JE64_FUSOX|nr:hypothetical protein FOZG_18519 [Fusarium oxysporum Fo47]
MSYILVTAPTNGSLNVLQLLSITVEQAPQLVASTTRVQLSSCRSSATNPSGATLLQQTMPVRVRYPISP